MRGTTARTGQLWRLEERQDAQDDRDVDGPDNGQRPEGQERRLSQRHDRPHKRKTEAISSSIMKPCSAGMTDEEMRVIIEFLYDAKVSRSYISDVIDTTLEDVKF